jgi:outer membrane protein TolC
LKESIDRGLKYNLGAELAGEAQRLARGQRIVALSRLLPNINARVQETSQKVNLAAFGLSVPGFPQTVGPFGLTDARAAISQQLLNFRALNQSRAAAQEVKAAEFNYQDARDTVVSVVASLYLQAASGASRIDAVKAQLAASQALYDQAVDFKKAGVVAGIEVLRAQVELQSQKQRLIAAENDFEKQKLNLARAIGLPDTATVTLADTMPDGRNALPSAAEAVQQALAERKDIRSQQARVTAAEFNLKAAHAGRLPSLAFNGDFGAIGPNPTNSRGTYTAALALNIPVWEGNRIKGESEQADANLRQLRAQLSELRSRVGFEIRSAMLDLNAAREQLDVNRSAVDLAKQQELQARDRFAAGVTNNLEVVQAQEALAAANENYIASLYSFNAAKTMLARSMGAAESRLMEFLQGGDRR